MVFCWLAFALLIHLPGKTGIYRVQKKGAQADSEYTEEKIRPKLVSSTSRGRHALQVIYRELGVLFWAGYFSLISAFDIGFPEINLGRWLRLLPRTEYELKAKGWARTVAGIQSLISLYLVTLWVLSYFGRPFE